MKNIVILVLLSVVLLSCSSDKNEEPEVKETRTVTAVCEVPGVQKGEIGAQWTTIVVEFTNDIPTKVLSIASVWDGYDYPIEEIYSPYILSSSYSYNASLQYIYSAGYELASGLYDFKPKYGTNIKFEDGTSGVYPVFF